jgi:hypothetical protein
MLIEKSKQTFLVLQRSTIKMGSTLSLLWSAPKIFQFYSINILPPQLSGASSSGVKTIFPLFLIPTWYLNTAPEELYVNRKQ